MLHGCLPAAATACPLSCQPMMQGPAAICVLLAALLVRAIQARRQAVYLLDFACYKPPEDLKVTLPRFMRGSREAQVLPSVPCGLHAYHGAT